MVDSAVSRPLAGKVVLVTGGGRGIGAAIAAAASAAGADVALLATRSPDDTRDQIASRGGSALAISGDVTVAANVERAVRLTLARFGKIDVLVNNAAILDVRSLLETNEESFDRVMEVNVKGMFLTIKSVGRHMSERGEGVIINIGSDLAVRGRSGYASYCASKGAALQLTRAAAIELGAFGIRVVMLSPAVTNTDLAAPSLADPAIRQELVDKGTIDRINEPEDVAAAAVFLASSSARTVTGCNWPVDAGVLAK